MWSRRASGRKATPSCCRCCLRPERTILVVSKIDALKNRDDLFAFVSKIMAQHPFGAVVPVSATKNQQLDQLLQEIAARLPEGEPMFEEDTLTDRPMRFIAAELVREKIFRLVGDELPYGCTVVIEQWEENDKGARIAACVVVERDSHKPISAGRGRHARNASPPRRARISPSCSTRPSTSRSTSRCARAGPIARRAARSGL